MRDDDYDDLDDLRRLKRFAGVSPVWRVVAIIGIVGISLLVIVVAQLGFSLMLARRSSPPVVGPPWPINPGPDDLGDDEEDDLPPNPPYPTVQDIRPPGALPAALAGEPPLPKQPSPRDQLVGAGWVVWTSDEEHGPDRLLVAPDEQHVAYIGGAGLMVGLPRAPRPTEWQPGPQNPGRPPRAAFPKYELPEAVSAWSPDGGRVYWTDSSGLVRFYDVNGMGPSGTLSYTLRARDAAPLPPDGRRLVLVRHRPRARVDSGAVLGPSDPSEVVLYTLPREFVAEPPPEAFRVLIPAGTAVWRSPAVSPDGKRLALISDSGSNHRRRGERVFVLDLEGGTPRPVTPLAVRVGSVCWTADGKSLVYDRGGVVREDGSTAGGFLTNLFEADPATGRETQLTRGGGISSPSVTRQGSLYCLVTTFNPDGTRIELVRAPLDKVRELAAANRRDRPDAEEWAALAGAVLQEAGVAPDARPDQLDEDKVTKLAAAFAKHYRARFKKDPPDTALGLEEQRREVGGLGLADVDRNRLALVLGAVEGDYLRRRHGARWAFPPKPTGKPLDDPETHDLFRHVANPFQDYWPEDEEDNEPGYGPLTFLLGVADGRPIVLTANVAAVTAHVPAADPDLARGLALLKENKGVEGDRVLLGMTKRHAGNTHLALHVGALLHEHGRKQALRELARRLDVNKLNDARCYNLVGVSLLDEDPRAAIEAFKSALRCNLYHGPAYLNLAQAYERAGNVEAARYCLKRSLKMVRFSPFADDARRRLAELPGDRR